MPLPPSHAHPHRKGDPERHQHVKGEAHDHGAEVRRASTRRLAAALALTAGFVVVEVVAGFWSGSLALLSDAGHMVTDTGALALALYAQALASRTRTGQRTFGFRRAEILAALVNGTVLGVSAVWVIVEAVRRLKDPPQVQAVAMMIVATAGLLVNLTAAFILSRDRSHNANVRAAVAHVLADAAGSVAAVLAGVFILWLGWAIADPIASIAISLLILMGAWRLVRDSVSVLMEGAPGHIEAGHVEALICETPGVAGLHDLHIWSVSDGFPVLTVHVTLAAGHHGTDVARAVAERIEERLGITHVTVQPEAPAANLVPPSALTREGRRPRPGEPR